MALEEPTSCDHFVLPRKRENRKQKRYVRDEAKIDHALGIYFVKNEIRFKKKPGI